MGKVIKKKIQGMSWQMKTSLVLLLTLTSMVFMYEGWYKPHQAAAAVAVSTNWAILGSSASNIAGLPAMSLAKPAASNRLLVVTFAGDFSAASATFAPVITYGGQTLTEIISTDTSSRQKVWIGYLNEAGIAAASTTTFAVSGTAPDTGCSLAAAFYNGVDQTTPVSGSRSVSSDTAATTPTSSPINVTNGGWAIYASNLNTAITSTPAAGYTELFDTANGALYQFAVASKAITATGTEDPRPTWSSIRYAFLSAALNPFVATGDTLTASANTAIAPSPQLATATNVLMQRFQVAASANTIEMNSLTINDLGTATLIDNVKVYEDTVSSATLPGTATLIGSQAAWNGAATTITLNQGATSDRTVTSGTPKFIYIVFDMNSGMATKTVQSQVTAVGVVAPDTGASGLAFNSTAITLSAPAGDTLTVGTNTPIATTSSDAATGVVMQRVQLDSNTAGDKSVVLSSVTIDDNGATATAYANAKIYIDTTASTILPGTAVLIGSQPAFTGASTVIALTGGTAADRTVTNPTSKYLYVVYDMQSGQSPLTAQSRITAVGVAAPDSVGTGFPYASNVFSLTAAPVATIGNCGGCHFYTGVAGNLPQDGTARNVPAGQFPGSHAVHANTYAFACSVCHRVPSTTSIADNDHSNGRIRMTNPINGNLNAKYGNVTSWTVSNSASITYNRCTTTVCHGQRSPVWGTVGNVNSCLTCHGQLAGTFVNFSAANIAPGGAGQDTGGNTATSSPRVGAHQNHLLAQSKMSQPVNCGECHKVHTTVLDATHLNYTTATLTFGPLATTAGHTPTVSRVGGVITCSTVYCHEGARPAGTGAKQRGNITTVWSFTGTSILDNTTITGTCTDKCHGMAPGRTVSGDTHFGIAAPTTVANLSVCSSAVGGTGCHPTLKVRPGVTNFTNLTSVFFNQGAQHIDGTVQGGSCMGCHSSVQGTRVAVANQFTDARNSHHYQGAATIDGKVCYACHWEADASGNTTSYHTGAAGGVADLVVWGTSTTRPTNYATNSVTYTSGGASASSRTELAKINNHCLGCHNDTNKNTATFVGDAATPSKYSWEALLPAAGGFGAAQSIDSKYSSTTTTLWGKFSGNYTNAKNSQIKAFSAHGNAVVNQRGWSTLMENAQGAAVANYPNTSGSTNNVLCFDCHNSHGSESTQPANAVTTSYSSATGRGRGGILKTTVAGLGGYTVSYRPYTGGNAAQKNPFKTGAGLCFDCHNNATVGLPTSTGYSTPWGYGTAGTFGSTDKIHGYNDNPYFGKTGGTFARGITYPYIGTGLPTNKGGHFGASSALTNATTFKIGGLCTPCHDPHGVSPGIAAANQQYAVPMLKETFVTSPYKMDAAPPSATTFVGGGKGQAVISLGSVAGYHIDQNTLQTAATGRPATALKWAFATSATTLQTLNDTQFAGLCLKCHSKANLNNTVAATSATGTDGSWKSPKRIHNAVKGWALSTGGGGNVNNKVHAYTCSKCHSTHNSNLPRLLVTNCLDVKHRGRVASTGVVGSNTGSGSSGSGAGRFPGGGGGSINRNSATNPGPWFFGTTGNPGATQLCHDSATAGGTTFNATSQLWNTKSPW